MKKWEMNEFFHAYVVHVQLYCFDSLMHGIQEMNCLLQHFVLCCLLCFLFTLVVIPLRVVPKVTLPSKCQTNDLILHCFICASTAMSEKRRISNGVNPECQNSSTRNLVYLEFLFYL